ncbi:HlyD family secretion protein [Sphingobacterium lumbrici]|uniref:HlyD family secretion protein n=1 Tax=Sphingobacterium lumbrici TaxID=2559600 RepID=UPI0011266829|nr:HlyD family efflux transporter periplasmic adaptor subunit [Sphingobacterium lumbrici]
MAKKTLVDEDIHSEDLQDIISKPPSWLLKRGISFVLLTVMLIIGLSVFVKYPEVVHGTLKINTTNAPKVIVNKVNGNLIRLLVPDGEWVKPEQGIAYIESTADHGHVLTLLNKVKEIRNADGKNYDLENIIPPNTLNLGELQGSYQSFYSAYLNYKAIHTEGIYQKRKNLLNDEVSNVNAQNERIMQSYELQKKELELAEAELEKYRLLAEKKVISPLELQQKEALLLSKLQIIPQTENNLISNRGNLLSKNRELSELQNQIWEQERMFVQALNSFISDAENWKKQYILTAPQEGKLIYGNFLQENQYVTAGQELFYINPGKEDYYGEMYIPQSTSSKVKLKQEVLIKVRSYPYQEYGYLRGKIDYISDIPMKDSVFFSKVSLIRTAQDSLIKLKPGIYADAEIITDDQSMFKRIWSNLTKSLKF